MNVLVEPGPVALVVKLEGADALDSSNASLVKEAVREWGGRPGHLVLSIGSVQTIDSAGIGALVTMLKAVRQCGGRMVLCSVRPSVLSVLDLIRLTSILEVYPDLEAATRALGTA